MAEAERPPSRSPVPIRGIARARPRSRCCINGRSAARRSTRCAGRSGRVDREGAPPAENVRAFATSLATGVAAHFEQLDPLIVEAAEHWRIERMNVMDRLIPAAGVYEFLHEPDTPAIVVINEALELGRTFSADESVRFINGILDAIRRTLSRE